MGDAGTLHAMALAQQAAVDALVDAEQLAADLLFEAQRTAATIVGRARTTAGNDRHPSEGPASPPPRPRNRLQLPPTIWVEEARPAPTTPPPPRAPAAGTRPAPTMPVRPPAGRAHVDEEFRTAIFRAIVGIEPLDPTWCDGDDIAQISEARGRAAAIRTSARRAAERAAAERLAIQTAALERRSQARLRTPPSPDVPPPAPADAERSSVVSIVAARRSPWVRPPREHHPLQVVGAPAPSPLRSGPEA